MKISKSLKKKNENLKKFVVFLNIFKVFKIVEFFKFVETRNLNFQNFRARAVVPRAVVPRAVVDVVHHGAPPTT